MRKAATGTYSPYTNGAASITYLSSRTDRHCTQPSATRSDRSTYFLDKMNVHEFTTFIHIHLYPQYLKTMWPPSKNDNNSCFAGYFITYVYKSRQSPVNYLAIFLQRQPASSQHSLSIQHHNCR